MSSSTDAGPVREPALLLFDIDGTLILSGGAGGRAMTRAFHAVFGHDEAFAGVHMAGRTDRFLLGAALAHAGVPDTDEAHRRFYDAYIPMLEEELWQPPTRGPHTVLPGVAALLPLIQASPGAHLALLTGNQGDAARIKLTHFGLWDFFPWGVFGDESEDRDELGRTALRRAVEHGVPASAIARAVVIGDTPQDIGTARAAGARAVAVATGSYPREVLEAAGADLVLDDLGDVERALDVLL
ncbi:MAG: HAD family hydrolase [Vicinamibacterales bacterium]